MVQMRLIILPLLIIAITSCAHKRDNLEYTVTLVVPERYSGIVSLQIMSSNKSLQNTQRNIDIVIPENNVATIEYDPFDAFIVDGIPVSRSVKARTVNGTQIPFNERDIDGLKGTFQYHPMVENPPIGVYRVDRFKFN